MDIPPSVQHRASLVRHYWHKMLDLKSCGPTWDPDRKAWVVSAEFDLPCDRELHEIIGETGDCDHDHHEFSVEMRFVRTRSNHGSWTDGGRAYITLDGAEMDSVKTAQLASLMSSSQKFSPGNQVASSQPAPSSTLSTKKNTVIRV